MIRYDERVEAPGQEDDPNMVAGGNQDPGESSDWRAEDESHPCSENLSIRFKSLKSLATWFIRPPTRQPTTFPMKKVLAIQDPTWRSIWIGSSGIVPFIILGMATLENDIQPPTHMAPNDTLTADRSWKED